MWAGMTTRLSLEADGVESGWRIEIIANFARTPRTSANTQAQSSPFMRTADGMGCE
jgi:hypothetical protein